MAATAQPIYAGKEHYVPEFEVKIAGSEAPREIIHDVTTVTYKDDIKAIDSFEIAINNWDAAKLDFKYVDNDLFDPGQTIGLWMGYRGSNPLHLMITGTVKSLRPTFPASGGPTLSVSGVNALDSLRKKQVSHSYEKKTDSQIAKEVISRIGLKPRIDDKAAAQEEPYEYVLQDNQYDIVFLHERAQRAGYVLVMEEGDRGKDQLYFGRSESIERPTYTLTWGKSLIQFQPNLTTANQVGKVRVVGWDPKNKKRIEHTATLGDIDVRDVGGADGRSGMESTIADQEEVVTDQPVESKAEAKRLAEERLSTITKDRIKGSGSTVGTPDLRAGSIVYIEGLGKRFSGRYFVTGTTHTIGDSGYTTQFQCRREET